MTTRAQHATQDDTREHRHECKHPGACGLFCVPKGYHECECGATRGTAPSSEWIKSHATDGGGYLKGAGWWI